MEDEPSTTNDLLGNVLRPSAVRVSRSFRASRSSTTSAQGSPSFKRATRTPRKDELEGTYFQWLLPFLNRRLVWLMLICLWIFLVLKMYSRSPIADDQELRQHLPSNKAMKEKQESVNSGISRLARQWIWTGYLKKNSSSSFRSKSRQPPSAEPKRPPQEVFPDKSFEYAENSSGMNFKSFPSLQSGDHFLGRVVGPYENLEQTFLKKLNAEERKCDGQFSEFVRGKRVLLLMHELSMTGSPLAMMELASEIQSCGGKVSVVVLDRRGGLLNELTQRKIPVVTDKAARSWRAAAKSHLVVAGSAVCASWIDNYLNYNRRGASRIVWWIMENRREYFERSKRVLGKVRALIFLSRIQAEQWEEWSRKDNISLPSQPAIVSLSVNDVIASASGIFSSSSNSSTENAIAELRRAVRTDMGLQPNDTLFVTLSSINPGKGQFLALQAAANALEQQKTTKNASMKLLFGSVGSKSNKKEYVEKMLRFLHQNPALKSSILWSPASVSVSALYAAADVYLMNAQGMGETFGRVTVEAMAFGLPILGTDAGGTKELVDANSTGLVHPVGLKGAAILTENMLILLNNPSLRKQMGSRGRRKVQSLYTKSIMYSKLALVFTSCL